MLARESASEMELELELQCDRAQGAVRRDMELKAGPLDLSFWSFLTCLHHGIEDVERHLL